MMSMSRGGDLARDACKLRSARADIAVCEISPPAPDEGPHKPELRVSDSRICCFGLLRYLFMEGVWMLRGE